MDGMIGEGNDTLMQHMRVNTYEDIILGAGGGGGARGLLIIGTDEDRRQHDNGIQLVV